MGIYRSDNLVTVYHIAYTKTFAYQPETRKKNFFAVFYKSRFASISAQQERQQSGGKNKKKNGNKY